MLMTRIKAGGPAIEEQGILVAFIVFMIAFSLMSDRFLSAGNIMSVFRQSAIIGVMEPGAWPVTRRCMTRPSLRSR
jgi:ribose transport system permease protein